METKTIVYRFIFLLTFFSLINIPTAGAESEWGRIFGGSEYDTARRIRQTTDGGFVIAGATYSFQALLLDIWILKLDAQGTIQWEKIYGGDEYELPYSLEQTSDNGYIVAGETSSFGAGNDDVWVMKLDSLGNIEWQFTYGGGGTDRGYSAHQTSDNGYIVAGGTFSFGGSVDIWVLKLTSAGMIEWQQTYDNAQSLDFATSIRQTGDGSYIVAAETYSDFEGEGAPWVLKLDQSGNVEWQKSYGYSIDFFPCCVEPTIDGGFIVSGNELYLPGPDASRPQVIKIDAAGNVEWQKVFTYGDAGVNEIHQTPDSGYILAGGSLDGAWLLKIDQLGNIQWQKRYGGRGDFAGSVQHMIDGYILAGGVERFDLWIQKVDENGEGSCGPVHDSSFVPTVIIPDVAETNTIHSTTNVIAMSTFAIAQDSASARLHSIFADHFSDGFLPTDWTYVSGSWEEANDHLIGSGAKAKVIASPALIGIGPGRVETEMSTPGGTVSFYAWYQDRRNNIEVLMKEESDRWVLRQRVNGIVVAKVKSRSLIEPDETYHVEISYDGSNFELYRDGFLELTMPKYTNSSPFGSIGFREKKTEVNSDSVCAFSEQ